jgi:predicted TIM-barrel fold metal-dependent hydrolase
MAAAAFANGIDCDVHPAVPNLRALLPYVDPYWRDSFVERGIPGFEANTYPPNSPLSHRPEWKSSKAALSVDGLTSAVFGGSKAGVAICTSLYGAELPYSEDMGRAVARAVNDWVRHEWLDKDDRLRASIIVPSQSVEFAVEEVERCAADPRFVQIKLMVMQESPLGRRSWWPLFAAAEKHGLPIALHPGSTYRHATTALGWPTYYIEDYVSYAQAFQSQLSSLVCEGVFKKYPALKVVLLESGVTWAPTFLWRLSKLWRGLRHEVPWVDRPPVEIVREHVRFTVMPFDAPPDEKVLERVLDHLGSDDVLLYASDFPHWQYDGNDPLPPHLPTSLRNKIKVDNPLATYPRLRKAPS